jgi:hypothetical protein
VLLLLHWNPGTCYILAVRTSPHRISLHKNPETKFQAKAAPAAMMPHTVLLTESCTFGVKFLTGICCSCLQLLLLLLLQCSVRTWHQLQ